MISIVGFGNGTKLSVIATTNLAFSTSEWAYPKAPQADFPSTPLIFPYSSEVGAATKAISTSTSPVSIILALPPWVCITAGFCNLPSDIAWATGPDIYPAYIWVTIPFSIYSTTGLWQGKIELATNVISLYPLLAISAIIKFKT